MQGFGLWAALVLPSALVVHRYAGWPGVWVHAALVAVVVVASRRRALSASNRRIRGLAFVTFALMTILFFVVYPELNVQTPGAGSDDDDAYNLGARALLAGRSPYGETTYLGNVLHQLPGAFILAAPFVVLGTSALQNLFWLAVFFLVVARERDARFALTLGWLVLVLSPAVLHGVLTGTAHVANTIYVAVGLWWLTRTSRPLVAAVLWGIALASRANFLFLLPLAFGWLAQRFGRTVALKAVGLSGATVVGLTLPFYLADPTNFGPLEAADRLLRLDAAVPYAGLGIAGLMFVTSAVLASRPMNRSRLFGYGAIVQAIPVVTGLGITTLVVGVPELLYAAYATFFAWFVFLAVAAEGQDTAHTEPG